MLFMIVANASAGFLQLRLLQLKVALCGTEAPRQYLVKKNVDFCGRWRFYIFTCYIGREAEDLLNSFP